MKKIIILAVLFTVLISCTRDAYNQKNADEALSYLNAGWANPPQAARTQVWWHWMNGNVTKHGIRQDLEWMKRIGLGGFQHFDAALSTPTVVDQRLIYMDAGWKDAFAYAAKLADSLGLEMAVASAPGWSSTGGPWVAPKDAMKKLVWRTLTVEGGDISTVLPEPYNTIGAFQNGTAAGRGQVATDIPRYYEDIAVIAVKLPESHISIQELGAKLSASGGSFNIEQLCNGDITDNVLLPSDKKAGFAWLMYEFPEPQIIRSVTYVAGSGRGMGPVLESSDDGIHFKEVCTLLGGSVQQKTVSIPATKAKYFRAKFDNPTAGGWNMFGFGAPARAPQGTDIAEFELFPYSKVNLFEDKAGFSAMANLTKYPTLSDAEESYISLDDVLDITASYKDGKLTWKAPEGTWKIFRFGYSLTGKQNHPAPPEATGLEVDKLDPVAWEKYFRTYLNMYKEAANGMLGQHGVQYVLTDSYEAEQETWTPSMFDEFQTRRGYNLTQWLPVLAGEVLVSPEQSDAFLWDWRKTIGDLITANYDRLTTIAQEEYGMLGRYSESHEAGRVFVVDGMDVKRTAQVPMSAMWVAASWLPNTPDGDIDRTIYCADDKESASVAHIYGQNVAAAESMTAMGQGNYAYSFCPENLKMIADIELSNGINRFIIHESAHQPKDDLVPGLSLGGIGQWFNRHETWAEMANVWVDYMSRSCFMLQAGKNVADILFYYGEDSNVTTEFGRSSANIPLGYEWDYLNPDALLNHISYQDGKLYSDSGTEYQILWMDRNVDYMSVPVLRKMAELAEEGAIIGGKRPKCAASVSDNQDEFQALVKQIWDSGKENVIETDSVTDVLSYAELQPDVVLPQGMKFLHRTMEGAEIYWLNKPSNESEKVEVSFRVSGLKPQVWHPDNGLITDISYEVVDDRTVVTLDMVQDDAQFVVFAQKGQPKELVPVQEKSVALTVESPWTVKFQEKRGAPAEAVFDKLTSYTDSDVFGIKYFSGVASYNNTFTLNRTADKYLINLGNVKNIAEVYVNGQYCGTAWKKPFMVDISAAVKEGANTLEVKVANLWVNRLIGDQQPNCPEKVTFCDSRPYRANDSVIPAGLIGPVHIIAAK